MRFFWRVENDINLKLVDYEMKACAVFGGKSSASCSNIALSKTAVDNGNHYAWKITTPLERNFHVDDIVMVQFPNVGSLDSICQDRNTS